ncbi:hypothetical protein Tdes44962_MAKER05034 [Teratosphaeria destructans]|uniref:Uncharacterized protein n=1 Tax=Teratosphaeria destructans TaxID=418781 RepID=A0A9W7SKV7_9PEZI|nr:hypothetical protein Tdes44962_MAKER05034 [Teratosphaeria destructans]
MVRASFGKWSTSGSKEVYGKHDQEHKTGFSYATSSTWMIPGPSRYCEQHGRLLTLLARKIADWKPEMTDD